MSGWTVRLLLRCFILGVVVYSSRYDPKDVGVWEGNLWIPPGGRLYSRMEMLQILQNRSLLIIGDSLGRRMASTIHFLLEKESRGDAGDISELDIDQDAHDSKTTIGHHDHVYKVPIKGLRFAWSPLLKDVEAVACRALESLRNGSVTRNVTLIDATDLIVEVGIHDSGKQAEGRVVDFPQYKDRRKRLYTAHVRGMLDCLTEINPTLRVFWRTAPFSADNNLTSFAVNETRLINTAARSVCGQSPMCTIVDTERLLESKSIGQDRLAGDSAAHFGGLARLTMIQLLLRAMDLTSATPLPHLE